MFFFEPLKLPDRVFDHSTEQDLTPRMRSVEEKTALLVLKAHDYLPQTPPIQIGDRWAEPQIMRIAVRQAGGGCLTPRIMLHKVFEQVVIDESDDSQLISLMGLQSADTEGEEFRRWIIGIHTEREIEEVDLDTQLAPGDTVVLYYLRGSDFL